MILERDCMGSAGSWKGKGNMKKRILSMLLACVMVVGLLAGCGGGKKDEGTDASKEGASSDGAVLVYAQGADPRGLDPHLVDDGESAKVTIQIYEGLLEYEETTTELRPCLAEEMPTVSEDGLTYTFKLRQGVKFHDGTDFNAEAVKFNIERQTVNKTEDMPYADFCYSYVDHVEVVDDYTVNIVLKEKYTPFLANIAMVFAGPIVSPTACEKYNNNLNENPCGTGPYKFNSWNKDEKVVLDRNEDYWGEPAKCKQVVIKTIPDASARVTALETGEVDIIDGIDPNMVEQLQANSDLQVNLDEGMNINYMAYNTERLTDPEVRIALSQAVNVDELVEGLYNGFATKADSILPTFLPGYSADVKQVSYDPEAAKATLAAKGVTKLSVITYSNPRPYNTATGKTLAETVQGYLKEVGVECDIQTFDWTTYKDKVMAGDYDICFYGWNGDNGDADNFLNLLCDENTAMNVARLKDATYNEMIAKAAQTPNGDERNAIYADAEKYLAGIAVWLPISHQQNITANRKNISHFVYHPTATVDLAIVEKAQ